ncbi:MAG: hypothetical protein WCP97_07185 [bacterium]
MARPSLEELKQRDVALLVCGKLLRKEQETGRYFLTIKLAEFYDLKRRPFVQLLKSIFDPEELAERERYFQSRNASIGCRANVEQLTPEKRREISARAVQTRASQTPEELFLMAQKGGKASAEQTSAEFKTERGKRGGRAARKKLEENRLRSRVCNNGNYFDSYAEAAVAALLSTYIFGFKLARGETFQVPLGDGKTADFFVNGLYIEFHPPRLFFHPTMGGDFANQQEYDEFRRIQNTLSAEDRNAFTQNTRVSLTERYRYKRQQFLPMGAELIVATSQDDIYNLVIKRFGVVDIDEKSFAASYRATLNKVKKQAQQLRNTRQTQHRIPSKSYSVPPQHEQAHSLLAHTG